MPSETNLQRIDLVALLTIGIIDHDNLDLFQLFRRLDISEGGFRNALSRKSVQSWFGIETFHVANTTTHEQPDHVLCPWGKVRLASRTRWLVVSCRGRFLGEHCMQCYATKPVAERRNALRSWLIADFCWEALLDGCICGQEVWNFRM